MSDPLHELPDPTPRDWLAIFAGLGAVAIISFLQVAVAALRPDLIP